MDPKHYLGRPMCVAIRDAQVGSSKIFIPKGTKGYVLATKPDQWCIHWIKVKGQPGGVVDGVCLADDVRMVEQMIGKMIET